MWQAKAEREKGCAAHLAVDVEAGEALVVGDPQRAEGLVIVHMEPVDGDVQVAAEQEAGGWGGQHPVVGQAPQIVPSRLSPHTAQEHGQPERHTPTGALSPSAVLLLLLYRQHGTSDACLPCHGCKVHMRKLETQEGRWSRT